MSWYIPTLAGRTGKGARVARPGSLAGLHAAREAHQSQFFTPEPVARAVWALVSPIAGTRKDRMLSLFDNSLGTGRLFQFADPASHALYGVDPDGESIAALGGAAEAACFERDFLPVGMQAIRPQGFDLGLINPPFSLTLESPHLFPYDCTHWGRFGANTAASSHAYALAQALDACSVVAAVLPVNFAHEVAAARPPRLAALVTLPAGAFAESGAMAVRTVIALFDCGAREETPVNVKAGDLGGLDFSDAAVLVAWEEFAASLGLTLPPRGAARLNPRYIERSKPVIIHPVTGDRCVHIAHTGRRIVLGFHCGLIEAKVRNALAGNRLGWVRGRRLPAGVRYSGQLVFDLEFHLAQSDPHASFARLIERVRAAGGDPCVDVGLSRYFTRRVRAVARSQEPFHRWVRVSGLQIDGARTVKARACAPTPLLSDRWDSPVIRPETELEFELKGTLETPRYRLSVDGHTAEFDQEAFNTRFTALDAPAGGVGQAEWREVYPGKTARFSALAHAWRARAESEGLNHLLSWKYQFDDLIELAINPGGAAVGWEPAMGKARLALALCLLHGGKHNLIVVEAGLLGEMAIELDLLNVDRGLYQFLSKPAQLKTLRRVNIISYERLRTPIARGAVRRTWARMLRRRLSAVVCDEADHLAHLDTAQTRAVWALSPKWRYALAGEPLPNYPRDLLPVIAWATGDGTAAQPYGYRRAYVSSDPAVIANAGAARRGVDQFRKEFVTLEWVTNEFTEKLSDGAKREVPKIGNLAGFRAFHAPHLLRRVTTEPECAPYLPIPTPRIITRTLEWDSDHLDHYLDVAEQFAYWYEQAKKGERHISLVRVLARIGAVFAAANHPFAPAKHCPAYCGKNSKYEAVCERLESLATHGHKTILYARSPDLLERLHRELTERGIEAVTFHGGKSPVKRMRELDSRFRFGPSPVLLASLGVAQKGLNIPQADRVIIYNRSWSSKEERQAIRRVLRSAQLRRVLVEFLHLAGSIDEYQAQMVAFKQDAADAGVDWQRSEYNAADFAHLDTILGRFCTDLPGLRDRRRGLDLRLAA